MREEGRVGERWGWRRQEREEQGSRDEEKAGNLEEEVGRAEAQRRGRGQGWEQRSQGSEGSGPAPGSFPGSSCLPSPPSPPH